MEITLCYKMRKLHTAHTVNTVVNTIHNTVSDVVEIKVQGKSNFQSGSQLLKMAM